MEKKLAGKTALVTGGARGLGRVYALRLAKLGANVGVIDIDFYSYKEFAYETARMTSNTVIDELKNEGVSAAGIAADIGDFRQVQAAVQEIAGQLGDIDILVANAGGGMGSVADNQASMMDQELLHKVMNLNFHGTVNAVTCVAPMMKNKRYGKIVTISSIAALYPFPNGGYAHYGSAKGAVITYTKYLAQELGKYGINANCMLLGRIGTGKVLEKLGRSSTEPIALGRLGMPEECADVLEFLTTDMSSYVTGAVIEVTGGFVGLS
jgi:3-oxoacyl-[acyl-carrier protein] reductase